MNLRVIYSEDKVALFRGNVQVTAWADADGFCIKQFSRIIEADRRIRGQWCMYRLFRLEGNGRLQSFVKWVLTFCGRRAYLKPHIWFKPGR